MKNPIAAVFIEQIKEGYIQPADMADVLYAMHAAMMDRFENVALWLPTDLEQVGDSVANAVNCAQRNDEDFPEEPEPRKALCQCDEEGAVQRFEAWMKEVVA